MFTNWMPPQGPTQFGTAQGGGGYSPMQFGTAQGGGQQPQQFNPQQFFQMLMSLNNGGSSWMNPAQPAPNQYVPPQPAPNQYVPGQNQPVLGQNGGVAPNRPVMSSPPPLGGTAGQGYGFSQGMPGTVDPVAQSAALPKGLLGSGQGVSGGAGLGVGATQPWGGYAPAGRGIGY